MNVLMDLDETSCDGQSCLGSKCFTRFIAFKIKHTICDKLGCDLYLRGVNVLVTEHADYEYLCSSGLFVPSSEKLSYSVRFA